jgi:hypothetical protein
MDKAFVYFRRDGPYFLSLEEAHNDSLARVTKPSSCHWAEPFKDSRLCFKTKILKKKKKKKHIFFLFLDNL